MRWWNRCLFGCEAANKPSPTIGSYTFVIGTTILIPGCSFQASRSIWRGEEVKPRMQVLEVWGDFACYSRPELKVERFSYPLPPPSAVRGVFDAIYCKPKEFRWQPERVELLAAPSY